MPTANFGRYVRLQAASPWRALLMGAPALHCSSSSSIILTECECD